ncbi:MAG: STAS domain-containing protein [Actinomycetota bacterium]|nr:STAS domain-containing protein [Actinomycetota bacterium]
MELSRWLLAEARHENNEQVIWLRGELDLSAVVGLEALIAAQRARMVVLELGGVSFCDVVGLAALVAAQQRLERRRQALVFRGVPERLSRLANLLDVSLFDCPDFPAHWTLAGERSPRPRSRRFSRSVDS